MNIHRVPLAEAFEVVRSAPAGLSSGEAVRRLAEYGPNRIQKAAREPAYVRLLASSFVSSPSSSGSPRGWPSWRNGPTPAKAWLRSAMRSWR